MPDDLRTRHEQTHLQEAAEGGRCGQAAAFVRGMLLLQERWVLMIVFSLLGGPTGFSELMRRGNVNTTTLTQRLNLLEQAGLLVKTIHSTMPPRTSYELTEAGAALRPILEAITQWSEMYLPVGPPLQTCPPEAYSTEACSAQACPPQACPPQACAGDADRDAC